ncbi:endonuclease/Exonuclease/phosphatase family domain protein [Burkholderia cepacia]|nr:endonuclease/Exonuclease/phosphatase family domain protein [Burkholderia cepacia]
MFSLPRIRIHPGELLVDAAVRRGTHSTTIYPLIARIRATPATGTSLAR